MNLIVNRTKRIFEKNEIIPQTLRAVNVSFFFWNFFNKKFFNSLTLIFAEGFW